MSMTLSRREFLRTVAGRSVAVDGQPVSSPVTYDHPVITHAGPFYRQPALTGQPPQVDRHTWVLTVQRDAGQFHTFTYADLLRLPARGEMRTLVNRYHQPGGEEVGNAIWRGVRLLDLLAAAGFQDGARAVRLSGLDGDTALIPYELARDTLLAYGMNGALLPAGYGFPLRALVPGMYDSFSVRWLSRITLAESSDTPYLEPTMPVRTFAQIMAPQPGMQAAVGESLAIQGIAFAGGRAITAVELSLDGGPWVPVTLRPPDSPYAWTQWYTRWTPQLPGPLTIAVRATDSNGTTQMAARCGTAQAEGIHRLTIHVSAD